MFNTVREAHIFLDMYLQQVATNRKQVFKPEHYDAILNTVILDYIEDKIDPKSNTKLEGFEDNQRRVDELRNVKFLSTLRLYNYDTNKKYTYLPSDYYKLIVGGSSVKIHYNKRQLSFTSISKSTYIYTFTFADDTPITQGLQTYKNTVITWTAFTSTVYNKPCYSKEGKFDIINFLIDDLKKNKGYDLYWEYYGNTYYKNKFILVSDVSLPTISITYTASTNSVVTNTSILITNIDNYNTTTSSTINKPIDLVSSKDIEGSLDNYYVSKNRQNKPLCIIQDNRLIVHHDSTFIPLNINLNYIIRPKLMNYYFNVMPELSINDEIITRATDKLKILIKDEQAYNLFNKQVQQIQ